MSISRMQFDDPFLSSLPNAEYSRLDLIRGIWRMPEHEFSERVSAWFSNFESSQKELALKILENIDYFDEARVHRRIAALLQPLLQFCARTNRSMDDVVLVTPTEHGDSADFHAYRLLKAWGLAQHQIQRANKLDVHKNSILVLFNDTHGTGNQFLRELWPSIEACEVASVFVLAISISRLALRRFSHELPNVLVLPSTPAKDIRDIFSAREFEKIKRIGKRVFPNHPLGYGGAGLLTAYHFQCPNNSIPLIWADGSNNKSRGKPAYPWIPLFPYHKKKNAVDTSKRSIRPEITCASELVQEILGLTDSERQRIHRRLIDWKLCTNAFSQKLAKWSHNFQEEDRLLARHLLLSLRYFDLSATRRAIAEFKDTILADVIGAGGDANDLLLVLTGDDKESVYRYEFDFIREFDMEMDQIRPLYSLRASDTMDRTLLFFYHTRSSGKYFAERIWPEIVNERKIRCRALYVLAFCMSDSASCLIADLGKETNRIGRLVPLRNEEASKPVGSVLATTPQLLESHARIAAIIEPDAFETLSPNDRFACSYYFQCPQASTPLIWSNHRWSPIFPRVVKAAED